MVGNPPFFNVFVFFKGGSTVYTHRKACNTWIEAEWLDDCLGSWESRPLFLSNLSPGNLT